MTLLNHFDFGKEKYSTDIAAEIHLGNEIDYCMQEGCHPRKCRCIPWVSLDCFMTSIALLFSFQMGKSTAGRHQISPDLIP